MTSHQPWTQSAPPKPLLTLSLTTIVKILPAKSTILKHIHKNVWLYEFGNVWYIENRALKKHFGKLFSSEQNQKAYVDAVVYQKVCDSAPHHKTV